MRIASPKRKRSARCLHIAPVHQHVDIYVYIYIYCQRHIALREPAGRGLELRFFRFKRKKKVHHQKPQTLHVYIIGPMRSAAACDCDTGIGHACGAWRMKIRHLAATESNDLKVCSKGEAYTDHPVHIQPRKPGVFAILLRLSEPIFRSKLVFLRMCSRETFQKKFQIAASWEGGPMNGLSFSQPHTKDVLH